MDDDRTWLSQALPIIRFRDYRLLTIGPKRREFVALYETCIVAGRITASVTIPESVYESDGASALVALCKRRGHAKELALAHVNALSTHQRHYYSDVDRIRILADSGTVRCRIKSRDFPNLYRAFALLLGVRYSDHHFPTFFGVVLRFTPFVLFTFLAFLRLLDNAFLYPLLMLMVVTFALAAAGTFPVRRRPSVKKKMLTADLSGKVPIRLPILGKVFTSLAALFVVAYLGYLVHTFALLDTQIRTSQRLILYLISAFAIFIVPCFAFIEFSGLLIALVAIGFVVNLGVNAINLVRQPTGSNLEALVITMAPYFALMLVQLGRSLQSRSAETETKNDKRQPVLYLRAFEDDVQDTITPQRLLAKLFGLSMPDVVWRLPVGLKAIFEAHPYRLLRSLVGQTPASTEMQLAQYFRKFGPFVAIGEPGERITPEGASREYVRNELWQQKVTDYMERSQFVVLQAASSEGFLWEVKTTLNRVAPEKILFCLSNFRERPNEYEDFRIRAESCSGWQFPRSIGNRREPHFLFYDRSRKPIVHKLSYLSPIKWAFRGTVSDLDYTLKAFVESQTESQYTPRTFPWHGVPATLIFLTVIPALWILILHATTTVTQFIRS